MRKIKGAGGEYSRHAHRLGVGVCVGVPLTPRAHIRLLDLRPLVGEDGLRDRLEVYL